MRAHDSLLRFYRYHTVQFKYTETVSITHLKMCSAPLKPTTFNVCVNVKCNKHSKFNDYVVKRRFQCFKFLVPVLNLVVAGSY